MTNNEDITKTVEEISENFIKEYLDTNINSLVRPAEKVSRIDSFVGIMASASLICAVIAVGYTSWIGRNIETMVTAKNTPMETFSSVAVDKIDTGLGRDALLLLTIVSLEQSLETSQPYAYELAVGMKAAQNDDILLLLQRLTSAAEVGVPTRQALFEAWQKQLASEIGITKRMGNVVNQMVNYDSQSKSDVEALFAANDAMKADNLSGALDLLSALEEESLYGFVPWMEMAMLRLEVEQTLSELRRLIFLSVLSD